MKNYAILATVLSTIIRGSTFLVIKNTVYSVDPIFLIALRFTIASLILFVYIYIKKGFSGFAGSRKSGSLLGLCFVGLYISQTIGLQYTSASNSAFITGMFLLFIPFFSYFFFKRGIKVLDILCILITLIGLYLLTGGVMNINYGDYITLITALCFALHIIFAERFIKTGSDLMILNFQQFIITGMTCLIISYFVGTINFGISLEAYTSIIYLSIFGSIIAYGLQFFGQKHIDGPYLGIILSLEPVFAFIFAIIFGGEGYTGIKIAGGMCIVFAMILPEIILLKNKNNTN